MSDLALGIIIVNSTDYKCYLVKLEEVRHRREGGGWVVADVARAAEKKCTLKRVKVFLYTFTLTQSSGSLF